jgi:hypothetical protein
MTSPEKVVESAKNVGYSGVILLGVGLMSAALYFTSTELISSSRDAKFHEMVLTEVKENAKCQNIIGTDIMGPLEGLHQTFKQCRQSMERSKQEDAKVDGGERGAGHTVHAFSRA